MHEEILLAVAMIQLSMTIFGYPMNTAMGNKTLIISPSHSGCGLVIIPPPAFQNNFENKIYRQAQELRIIIGSSHDDVSGPTYLCMSSSSEVLQRETSSEVEESTSVTTDSESHMPTVSLLEGLKSPDLTRKRVVDLNPQKYERTFSLFQSSSTVISYQS